MFSSFRLEHRQIAAHARVPRQDRKLRRAAPGSEFPAQAQVPDHQGQRPAGAPVPGEGWRGPAPGPAHRDAVRAHQ